MTDNQQEDGTGHADAADRAVMRIRARIADAPAPRWAERRELVVDFTPWRIPVFLAAAASVAVAVALDALRPPQRSVVPPATTFASAIGLPAPIAEWMDTRVPPSNEALAAMRRTP